MKKYLQFIKESYDTTEYEADDYFDLYVLYCRFLKEHSLGVLQVKRSAYIQMILDDKIHKSKLKVGDIVLTASFIHPRMEYRIIRLEHNPYGYVEDEYIDEEKKLACLGNEDGNMVFDMYSTELVIDLKEMFYNVDKYLYELLENGKINRLMEIYKEGGILPQDILDQLKDIKKQSEWS